MFVERADRVLCDFARGGRVGGLGCGLQEVEFGERALVPLDPASRFQEREDVGGGVLPVGGFEAADSECCEGGGWSACSALFTFCFLLFAFPLYFH